MIEQEPYHILIILNRIPPTAQDLLDSWVHEKKFDEFDLEVKFQDERWAHSIPTRQSTRQTHSDGMGSELLDISTDGNIQIGDSLDNSLGLLYEHRQPKPGENFFYYRTLNASFVRKTFVLLLLILYHK